VANRSFLGLDELDAALSDRCDRCVTLSQMPEVVRSSAQYHWWPTDA
jgi:hypothetical protein